MILRIGRSPPFLQTDQEMGVNKIGPKLTTDGLMVYNKYEIMKRIAILFVLVSFIFASCSSPANKLMNQAEKSLDKMEELAKSMEDEEDEDKYDELADQFDELEDEFEDLLENVEKEISTVVEEELKRLEDIEERYDNI